MPQGSIPVWLLLLILLLPRCCCCCPLCCVQDAHHLASFSLARKPSTLLTLDQHLQATNAEQLASIARLGKQLSAGEAGAAPQLRPAKPAGAIQAARSLSSSSSAANPPSFPSVTEAAAWRSLDNAAL